MDSFQVDEDLAETIISLLKKYGNPFTLPEGCPPMYYIDCMSPSAFHHRISLQYNKICFLGAAIYTISINGEKKVDCISVASRFIESMEYIISVCCDMSEDEEKAFIFALKNLLVRSDTGMTKKALYSTNDVIPMM